NMVVTCLYGVLGPDAGHLVFANAGHNLPVVSLDGNVSELRARGMPLGLMSGMRYEETEAVLEPGAHLLLYSDGLTEAHDSARDMFGSPRLAGVMAEAGPGRGDQLIDALLSALGAFTGDAEEQEDDITLVAIRRIEPPTLLAEFSVASEPGNEREAIRRLEPLLASQGVSSGRLERLKTAVAEATMNAMEHGNGSRPETSGELTVLAERDAIR